MKTSAQVVVYYFLKWFLFGLPIRAICRFTVEGKENLPRHVCMIVSNHVSGLDSFAIQARLRLRIAYVAKKELFKIPVFSWLMIGSGTISIDRKKAAEGDMGEMLRLSRNARDRVDRGFSIGMFPEGTRSRDGLLGSFMDGAAGIAIQRKLMVVPVGIRYKWFWLFSWSRPNPFPGLVVEIVIGEPIDTAQFKSKEELTAALRQAVAILSRQKLAVGDVT